MVDIVILQHRFLDKFFCLGFFLLLLFGLVGVFFVACFVRFFPPETITHICKWLSRLPSLKAAASLNS